MAACVRPGRLWQREMSFNYGRSDGSGVVRDSSRLSLLHRGDELNMLLVLNVCEGKE